jgi:Mg/Co/Ni transporter MgtE
MADEIKHLREELVRDAETLIVCDPATVQLGSKVIDAVDSILKDPRTQTVYVVDMYNKLMGTITVNDLLKISAIQVGAYRKFKVLNFFTYMSLLYSEIVDEIMRKPIAVRKEDKFLKALQIMEENDLADLPVIDDSGELIGELNGLEMLTLIQGKINNGELDKLK